MGPPTIRIALIGVGNCAKSLVEFLATANAQGTSEETISVGRERLAGEIEVVAAFDIDARKVHSELATAILSPPNCAMSLGTVSATGVVVQRGPTLDGLPKHLRGAVVESRARPMTHEKCVRFIKEAGVDINVILLPTGSHRAVEWWAEVSIAAGVSMINATPTFLARRKDILRRFQQRGCCYIGDDLKSQMGATIVHRTLLQLCRDQGVRLHHTSQINAGGNTDFKNLKNRGVSKKKSKSNSIKSVYPELKSEISFSYDVRLGDHKTALIEIVGNNSSGAPFSIQLRLDVEDSPNAAPPLVDAIRCLAAARSFGYSGYLLAPSAKFMKSPARGMDELDASEEYEAFIAQIFT